MIKIIYGYLNHSQIGDKCESPISEINDMAKQLTAEDIDNLVYFDSDKGYVIMMPSDAPSLVTYDIKEDVWRYTVREYDDTDMNKINDYDTYVGDREAILVVIRIMNNGMYAHEY
jgi:hypothetical protein